jgi:peptide/nickel transport system permease protein
MIPTLFGILLLTFLIIQLSPGDPMRLQIGRMGEAKAGAITSEQYKIMREQFNLDKPLLINLRPFINYEPDLKIVIKILGLPDQELPGFLEYAAEDPSSSAYKLLCKLDIEKISQRIKDPRQRIELVNAVKAASLWYLDDIGEWTVPGLVKGLKDSNDLKERLGAILALRNVVGRPFKFYFAEDAPPEQVKKVKRLWLKWWEKNRHTFREVPQKRREELNRLFNTIKQKRSKKFLGNALYEFYKSDAPFLIERLSEEDGFGLYAGAAILCSLIRNPLPYDPPERVVKQEIDEVADNWLLWWKMNRSNYQPGFLKRCFMVLTQTQFFLYLWNTLFRLDFGKSMIGDHEPVGRKIWGAVKVSAPIMLLSTLLIYLIAVPLGILAAVKHGKPIDRMIAIGLFILYSIPGFVAAVLFQYFFCNVETFKLFPVGGIHSEGYKEMGLIAYLVDYLWHVTLPVICLSVFTLAALAMYSRTGMLQEIRQDYIRTARAKGLDEKKVIFKHLLRNGLIPIITLFAGILPVLLGGSVLIETIFSIPGMGRLGFDSVNMKDLTTLMALTVLSGVLVMLGILLSDILYVLVDPRISFEKAQT